MRPTAGLLEWVSKGTHGLGLVCLGREAILGSAQRRMRAPGSLADEAPDVRSPPEPCCNLALVASSSLHTLWVVAAVAAEAMVSCGVSCMYERFSSPKTRCVRGVSLTPSHKGQRASPSLLPPAGGHDTWPVCRRIHHVETRTHLGKTQKPDLASN